jgi:hypothetical protein
MVAEIERLYYRTRRAFRVSYVCAIVTALCAGWNLADLVGKLLAG